MKLLKNPFAFRASENLDFDTGFLEMYSSLSIDVLIENYRGVNFWASLNFLRSSPGSGKTSIINILLPQSLNRIYLGRKSNQTELFNKLNRLNVFGKNGVNTIGIKLPCTYNYSFIHELDVPQNKKSGLFISLINARILLGALRGLYELFGEDSEDSIKFYENSSVKFESDEFSEFKLLVDIYRSAKTKEKCIHSYISGNTNEVPIDYYDIELTSLKLLSDKDFLKSFTKPLSRFVVMFDDVHYLTPSQREQLIETADRRFNTSVWISERLEAIRHEEGLIGVQIGRDYNLILLEDFWINKKKQFEKLLDEISNKRISKAELLSDFTFDDCVNVAASEAFKKSEIIDIAGKIKNEINEKAKYQQNLISWAEFATSISEDSFDDLILLSKINIVFSRTQGQSSIFPFQVDQLEEEIQNVSTQIAFFRLHVKYKLPYYFGISELKKLSSFNIEQYLSYVSRIFDASVGTFIKSGKPLLNIRTQEKIIKNIAEEKWKNITLTIPNGRLCSKFLENFGTFCKADSKKPNVPYPPGVTGFGILEMENESLFDQNEEWYKMKHYSILRSTINTCVAYNLLYVKRDVKQNNQRWSVFYLNRSLCIYFNLTQDQGGWRGKKPSELNEWLK